MMNIRKIAGLAGVSISTVSRVLNGHHNVDEETRLRVQSIIDEYGYVPRRHTQAQEQRRTVGVVLSDDTGRSVHEHPTVYTFLAGLTNRLGEMGVSTSLHMLGGSAESIDALVQSRSDGFVFIRTHMEQEEAALEQLLAQRGEAPILMMNRRPSNSSVSYVSMDDVSAAFQATEYLIHLGHRSLALVNGDESLRNSLYRREGFLKALAQYGMEPRAERMLSGAYTEEFGRQAADILWGLADEQRPDAVFATSDVIALGVMKGLKHLGCRIPEDVSVIGFGDDELASYVEPPLTTMRLPAREMGVQAANAMNALLQSPSIRNIRILMDSELCIRTSTMRRSE